MIPPFLLTKAAAAAAIAATAFLAGMSTHKLVADRKIARVKAAHAVQVTAWEAARAAAEQTARATEARLQGAVDQSRRDLSDALQQIDRQVAAVSRLRVDRDRLHDDLTAFAAASPAADTIAACRGRAERLAADLAAGAGLLGEGADLAIDLAAEADRRGVKLRALSDGWPR